MDGGAVFMSPVELPESTAVHADSFASVIAHHSLPPRPEPVHASASLPTPPAAVDGSRAAQDQLRSLSVDEQMLNGVRRNPPIDILPMPLPSKRFKKKPVARSPQVPLERLPTFPLPPLPPIPDADLLKQVFTHCSLFARSKGQFEDPEENPPRHYEKLEHVGDSVLGMLVTIWLHEIKPGLTCGTATKLKAHLVSNATLSHLSSMYNLPQRLNADPYNVAVLRAQTDVRAALFEAYIAGIYHAYPARERQSKALPIIDAWLRELYEPLCDHFYTLMKQEHDQLTAAIGEAEDGSVIVMDEEVMRREDAAAVGMVNLVKMYGDTQRRVVSYGEDRRETSFGLLWTATCTVDGIDLGQATRSNKKAARDVAAWQAANKLGLVQGFEFTCE